MTYITNPSPSWLAQLGLIDEWGPEVSPADIPDGSHILAVRLLSGMAHLMRSDNLNDFPSDDPPAAAVIIDHLLIDDSDLFNPKARTA
jgi:hypothetical protein